MSPDDLIIVIAAVGFLAGVITGWTLAMASDTGGKGAE